MVPVLLFTMEWSVGVFWLFFCPSGPFLSPRKLVLVFEPGDPWMDLPVLRTVTEEDMWALSANQPTWKCGKYGQLVPQMSAHPLLLRK